MPLSTLLEVPATRRDAIRRIADTLQQSRTAAITTHINADGDACGSVAAMALLLPQLGVSAVIVNPTPWPSLFGFLLAPGLVDHSAEGVAALQRADTVIALDVSDVKRLGVLTAAVRQMPGARIVIDHHVPTDEPAGDVLLADTEACATGELLYDFARELGLRITPEIAAALYCAILTDTGGFRYSNTSPRCHAIAAELLALGVDPESMYRRIYASLTPGRLHLLRDALGTLGVDELHGIAWVSIRNDDLERYEVSAEDLDGIVEHPRSIAGTRVALFFRDLGYGKVKVSFRSTGDVDVNTLARQFGGGGHAKASGALIAGSLEQVLDQVVVATREFVGPVPTSAAARQNGDARRA
ncbi:MAG TPA: bifunctional oligoribonuclease/PAP phosphatase NrnA [Gemmatimonadaceae bacterium]|nr:bifunctional oligoribonuclease/PAP phosphatase NrnA [Gemmatimonadaceae bacterium]